METPLQRLKSAIEKKTRPVHEDRDSRHRVSCAIMEAAKDLTHRRFSEGEAQEPWEHWLSSSLASMVEAVAERLRGNHKRKHFLMRRAESDLQNALAKAQVEGDSE